jgi:hypothetical protein
MKLTIKYNSSLDTGTSKTVLYKLLTFHVPNLMSKISRSDRFSKESVQDRGALKHFIIGFCLVRSC